jgi:hypothetical protein
LPQGPLVLEAPQPKSAQWVDQVYWDLRVPAGEHVILPPADYVQEQRWTWADYFWRREPTLGESELEAWIRLADATPQTQTAAGGSSETGFAAGSNRYLFSTVGRLQPLDVYTLGRARIVLLASLPLLLCGLMLIYLPATRHPAVLLLGGVVLASASLIAPHATLLLAQASVVGLLLVCLAAILARLVPARVVPVPASQPGSSLVAVERSITEMYQRPPSGGSRPPSTTLDPLVPTSPEAES